METDKLPQTSFAKVTSLHPDNRFIKGIIENDHILLEEIYNKFLPGIIQFIQANTGNREDALDAFQEAILIIYKKSKTENFIITSSFYNYIYTICKNLWMRELTRRKSGVEVKSDKTKVEPPMELEVDFQLREIAMHRLFLAKFRELPEGCRKILQSFFEGASMKKIAMEMEFKSEGYAKKRKHLCQQKLIKAIKEDAEFRKLTGD